MKTRDLIVWGGLALLAWAVFKPTQKPAPAMPGQIGPVYGDDPTEVAKADQEPPPPADIDADQDAQDFEPLPQRPPVDEFSDEALEAF
jgi:hypothetical protein